MGERTALVRVDDIARAYDFGSSHPLRPERVLLTYSNIEERGLLEGENVSEVPARVATDEEIATVHDRAYIDVVKAIDEGSIDAAMGLEFGLGTADDPIFDGMHPASAAVCGASITAAEVVASGSADHAFNPAGGLHHARRSEASGFCIYNDPAAAIARILAMEPAWRVAYLDIDVHHGDGVQWIFYDEPRVLTISLHQSGHYLYPGTGFEDEIGSGAATGTSINVPLLPYTGTDDYLWALGRVLPAALEAFSPDVLVTQLGADTHHGDPLAALSLTMDAYPLVANVIHASVHRFAQGRWVATGGGGYQAETIVPKVWTIHFAEMCGQSDAIPDSWLQDRPSNEVSSDHRDHVARTVDDVLGRCLPALQELAAAR